MNYPEQFPAREPCDVSFAMDVVTGLGAHPKHLSSKYFYDDRGSILFEQICALPEYYPTRVETGLLKTYVGELADIIGPQATVVEFGAGALKKIEILLDALQQPAAYVPIDISGDFLQAMAHTLRASRPELMVRPVIADFTKPMALPGGHERRIGFFPGSTIGNLEAAEAVAFLRRARSLLQGGGLLIGVDLVKDPAVLHAAYNDAAGVTAAFNKNLLHRANGELGTDFDVGAFAHYAYYSPSARRIEMHLMSLKRQTISLLNREFTFEEGETIHTENSHKYTIEDFQRLALIAGFVPKRYWVDKERLFSLHWLEAEQP